MSNIVKNLRGTKQEWEANDCVIPDGAIALLRTDNGYFIKIGNGITPFSDLPFTFGKIEAVEGDSVNAMLTHGLDLRMSTLTELTLGLPEVMPEYFVAALCFDSGDVPTTLTYLFDGALFSGDSLEDGIFVPEENTHYTLFVWYDGIINCHVRGVKYV